MRSPELWLWTPWAGKALLIKHCASKGKEFAFLGGQLPLQGMLYFLGEVFVGHKALSGS